MVFVAFLDTEKFKLFKLYGLSARVGVTESPRKVLYATRAYVYQRMCTYVLQPAANNSAASHAASTE